MESEGLRLGQKLSFVFPSKVTGIESGMYPTLIVFMNARWEANASLANESFWAHLNHEKNRSGDTLSRLEQAGPPGLRETIQRIRATRLPGSGDSRCLSIEK